jgi:hypothetical protein
MRRRHAVVISGKAGEDDMRCCGADIGGKDLILAIVENISGSPEYIVTNPAKITLRDDEDQTLIKSFFETVSAFMRTNNIDLVAIKKRATKGKFAGGSVSFKIESILQLLPDCTVRLYPRTTIAANSKAMNLELPDGIYAYQGDAFLTACCALATVEA